MTKKPTKINNRKKNINKNDIEATNQFNYIILFAFGLLLFFIVLIKGKNLWQLLHDTIFGLFGFPSFFIGILNMFLAILFSSKLIKHNFKYRFYQFVILFILLCSQIQTYAYEETTAGVNIIKSFKRAWQYGVIDGVGGGVVGEVFSAIFRTFLGKNAAIAVIWILLFVFFLIITSSTLFGFFRAVFSPVKKVEKKIKELNITKKFNIDIPIEKEEINNNEKNEDEDLDFDDNLNFFKKKTDKAPEIKIKKKENKAINVNYNENKINNDEKNIEQENKNKEENFELKKVPKTIDEEKNVEKSESIAIDHLIEKASEDYEDKFKVNLDMKANEKKNFDGYKFPPLSFLDNPKNLEDEKNSSELKLELTSNAKMLIETLASFGVKAEIINICRGPSVTRYEIQPSAGVKLSKITNLADDISLNLAAGGVIIAPVPDKKSIVGIEVPNKKKNVVYIKEVISSEEFINAKSPLTFVVGKDIAGNVKLGDIAKMPHILIAGATGSGKSVCVNSLIVSLIYKSSPSEVRLLMIDPKVVELGVYNGIPHLLVPVVTQAKKAAGALSWAVAEMMKRYKMFAETGVRDMKNFNLLVESGKKNPDGEQYEKMPHIVIIIDELADLMMAASREVESSICRLAQMARAAGMHIVIATQRPSVDVITGLIKANIPSRIAFTVSSQIDSRTIIDMVGAEKLLGKGDMLYYPMEERKPIRVQGCFLTDKEIERVVEFIKKDENVSYSEEIIKEIDRQALKNEKKSSSDKNLDEKDPMIIPAMETVVESGQASTSFLQRKLKLGYSRAARIMDELESMGVVGTQSKSKPREILMSKEQFLQMYVNKSN